MKHIAQFLLLLIVVPAYSDDVNDATYFASIGAPMCGYGQYRIGNTCYRYGRQNNTLCDGDSVSGAACLAAFVESSGEFENLSPFAGGYTDIGAPTDVETYANRVCGGAGVSGAACLAAFVESSGEYIELSPFAGGFADIGAPFQIETYADRVCGGEGVSGVACLYAFVESSGAIEDWFPFSAGLSDIGAPSDVFVRMKENDCIGTMDGYYTTGIDWFTARENYQCSDTSEPYIIANDCQYIDMANRDPNNVHSPLNPENWLCAVLCDTGKVYTSVEKCATPCAFNGGIQRLHVGEKGYSAPLYMERLTQPSMNFRFYNDTMCYMNLRPTGGPNKVAVQYNDTTYYSSY